MSALPPAFLMAAPPEWLMEAAGVTPTASRKPRAAAPHIADAANPDHAREVEAIFGVMADLMEGEK